LYAGYRSWTSAESRRTNSETKRHRQHIVRIRAFISGLEFIDEAFGPFAKSQAVQNALIGVGKHAILAMLAGMVVHDDNTKQFRLLSRYCNYWLFRGHSVVIGI